jgi:hypothetical protein
MRALCRRGAVMQGQGAVQRIVVLDVMTHGEYDRGNWK